MQSNAGIASMIETAATAYAAYAAETLLERHPETGQRFEPHAFAGWKGHLRQRLFELATAIEQDQPALFLAQVNWSREAFEARGVPSGDLKASLECLRDVLRAELPEGSRPVPEAFIEDALAALDRDGTAPARLTVAVPHGRLALLYVQTVLEGKRRAAIGLVLDAIGRGELTSRDAYLHVLAPAQIEIGHMWHAGEINIAEEHLLTTATRDLVALLAQQAEPSPPNGKTVLAAAVTGNDHYLGVRVVGDLFTMAGCHTVDIGADVPPLDLAQAVFDFGADLVVLSAALSTQLRALHQTIEIIRANDAGGAIKVLVGGLAFADAPDLWRRLGADGYAANAPDALAAGQRLLGLA